MRKPVEGLIWFIVLLSFSIILGVLLIGGTIRLFLAPRMVPVVWFGFCIFCILSIYQATILVRDLRTHRGGAMKLYTLVFVLPVFLIVTATPQASTPQMLPNPNIGFKTIGNQDNAQRPSPEPAAIPSPSLPASSPDPGDTPVPTETPAPENTKAPVEETPLPEETPTPEKDIAEMPICVLTGDTIAGKEAGPFEESLYTLPQDLFGQTIKLHGFVHKDDSFPPNTILVSRLMITCCTADAMVVGFHVRVEDADAFSNDEWIQVTGMAQRFAMEMYGEIYVLPILTGGTITRCEGPPEDEAYVYP